jgi:hypothetical protein
VVDFSVMSAFGRKRMFEKNTLALRFVFAMSPL